ncbi:MAG TPA: WbqC family protein [Burkholderiales bacterium]|nr:WbqC family protein [Burkholderiales bacterium]
MSDSAPLAGGAPARTAVVVQSSYIPWKGYFDLIGSADEFVLFDDVQYTRRDWRNRNRIKTAQGIAWLTIPVAVKGKYHQRIRDTRVSDPGWARRHWATLVQAYSKAPYFREGRDRFEPLYLGMTEQSLSLINRRFIDEICDILGIRTRISWSMDYELKEEGKNERLLGLCKALGCNRYLSGPSARGYLDEALFGQNGISVEYMDYLGYPEYAQLHGPFVHEVSILDLIFNAGPHVPRYMKSARVRRQCNSA